MKQTLSGKSTSKRIERRFSIERVLSSDSIERFITIRVCSIVYICHYLLSIINSNIYMFEKVIFLVRSSFFGRHPTSYVPAGYCCGYPAGGGGAGPVGYGYGYAAAGGGPGMYRVSCVTELEQYYVFIKGKI